MYIYVSTFDCIFYSIYKTSEIVRHVNVCLLLDVAVIPNIRAVGLWWTMFYHFKLACLNAFLDILYSHL